MSMKSSAISSRLLTSLIPSMRKLQDELLNAKQEIASLRSKLSSIERTNAILAANRPFRSGNGSTASLDEAPLQFLFAPPTLSAAERDLVNQFHNFMYDIQGRENTRSYYISWLGRGMFKWPTDLWIYQQIITESLPDVIVETGTHCGGSAFFLATICDLLDHGRVISVDIDTTYEKHRPHHPRITYISGSSTDPTIVEKVRATIGPHTNVLVILDSDHRCPHVRDELGIYSTFVPVGGYLIVEDTNVNGHPAYPDFGPGPWEAVELFLKENIDFVVDRDQERFFWTQNPRGFLRRQSLTKGPE
jgi:cephalosporin hydroxylase